MKKWHQSKTVWFNLIMTAVLTAELVGGLYPSFGQASILLMGLGNLILRVWFTDTVIEKK